MTCEYCKGKAFEKGRCNSCGAPEPIGFSRNPSAAKVNYEGVMCSGRYLMPERPDIEDKYDGFL